MNPNSNKTNSYNNNSTIQELITDPSTVTNSNMPSKDILNLLNKTKEERNKELTAELMNSELVKNSSQLTMKKMSNLEGSSLSYRKVAKEEKDEIRSKINDMLEQNNSNQEKLTLAGKLDLTRNPSLDNCSNRNDADEEAKIKKKKERKSVMINNINEVKNYNVREEVRKSAKLLSSKILMNANNELKQRDSFNRDAKTASEASLSRFAPNIELNKDIAEINNHINGPNNNQRLSYNINLSSCRISSGNVHVDNFLDKKAKFMMERIDKRRDSRKRTSEVNTVAMNSILKQSEINTVYGRTLRALKLIDVFVSIILIANIVLSVLDNEIYITYTDIHLDNYLNKTQNETVFSNITNTTIYIYANMSKSDIVLQELLKMEERELSDIENLFRFVNGILSITAGILVIMHYKKKLALLQIDLKLSKYDNIWTSGLFKYMVMDVFIASIFYPPIINRIMEGKMLGLVYAYSWNSIFSVVVMIKIYLILRVMKHFSRWTTETATAVCNNYKVKSGAHFAIKAEMRKRPATILSILLIVSLSLLAFSVRSFEYGVIDPINGFEGVKGKNDLQNLANCFWLIIVTMTTVGFGDFYPRSHLGRLVGVFACIIGMLLLSLIVVSLGSISEFSPEEKKAFSKLKKLFADDNLENKAANVIKTILLLKRMSNDLRVSKSTYSHQSNQNPLMERFIYLTQLKKEISFFKNDYKISNSYSLPVDEMLKRLEDKLQDDIFKLTNILKQINGLDVDLDGLAKEQQEVQDTLVDVIKMQDDISKYMVNLNNECYLQNMIKKKKMEEEIKARKEAMMSSEKSPGRRDSNRKELIEKSPRRRESKRDGLKSSRSILKVDADSGITFKRRKSKRESTKKAAEDLKTATSGATTAFKKSNNRLGAELNISSLPNSKRNSTVSKSIQSTSSDGKGKKAEKQKVLGLGINMILESTENINTDISVAMHVPIIPKTKFSQVNIIQPEESNAPRVNHEFMRYNTMKINAPNNDNSLLGPDQSFRMEKLASEGEITLKGNTEKYTPIIEINKSNSFDEES